MDTTTARTLRLLDDARPARCSAHPAFEADYCPTCGSAQIITNVVTGR